MSQLTGLGQYALHLATGLSKTASITPHFFYGTHFSERVEVSASRSTSKARALVRSWLPQAYAISRIARQRFFDSGVKRLKFDVYHEPNYLALKFDGPTVITVHDLSWIRYPETHPIERVRAMNTYFEPALRRAAVVLTDSEFVRAEVIQEFGLRSDAVRSIPLGLDPAFRPMCASETRNVLEALGLTHGAYFLSVGTLEPRKNLLATIQAYSSLPGSVRARYPLVLAGMKGWRTSALEQLLEPGVKRGEVRVLGYVGRDELATITAGALAMVYPSLYEGFGFPPLESMGCGVPPVISTAGSLLEVVGDCGLTVEPNNVEALAAAMTRMIEDPELRKKLASLSLQRADTFTWQRCIQSTVDAYRHAATTPR